MKLELRRLRPGEQDYEFVFGVLFFTLFLATAAGVVVVPEGNLPVCQLREITGVPCPACGVVRSLKLLWTGHPLAALIMHPFGFCLVVSAVIYMFYSWVVVIGRRPRIRLHSVPPRLAPAVGISLAILLLINWIYLLITV